MLSRETLENHRRMTPGERLRLTLDLTKDAAKALLHGSQARKLQNDSNCSSDRTMQELWQFAKA